ncbi:LytTR family DNA-binding domain-containing protein [Bacteroides sp. 224]|uniref:LytR/AlgR family response regulator transcription factor n=1 Tax=Bacteroides sp. 224 TaxID=2302936 RepID=UPI0013CF98D0|nr:LytTR family DNA-binding domain-containing protein [Bacteroides sp. 224]NDV66462.1 DNA-binding response regulator [Bacteroides sp. 224]
MNCIIVDDEPLARRAVEILIEETGELTLLGMFNSAASAARFMNENPVDLVFLDIQMPKMTGLEFARSLSDRTLVIFTTAYTEYAAESYDIDVIDYLVKPIELPRFQKAVNKAISYHSLLLEGGDKKDNIETIEDDFLFIKCDRKFFKVEYKDILFIEGLKDYSIIQCDNQRLIARMNLKNIYEELPSDTFLRVSKSYIINMEHIHSFDNNSVYIKGNEILIGNNFRELFMEKVLRKKKRL